MQARFFDGRAPLERQVNVRVADGVLFIESAEQVRAWAVRDIRKLAQDARVLRLASNDEPDARLILENTKENRAALAQAGAIRNAGLGWAAGLAILLAVSAALIALIFVGAPAAAPVFARATPPAVESQLGTNLLEQVNIIMPQCSGAQSEAAALALAPMTARLRAQMRVQTPISVTFARASEPNAIALPGGHIVVTKGLLNRIENQDEFAAILAHELAHVRARDGLIALYRNMGLGMVLDAITGGSGIAQQIVLLGGQMTLLRFTREQESAADRGAVLALDGVGMDPAAMARALENIRVAADDRDQSRGLDWDMPEWLASHPNINARITAAQAHARPGRSATILSAQAWAQVRSACDAKP